MKTQNFASLKLLAAVLFSSLFFTQANAQCVANWGAKKGVCAASFLDLSKGNPAPTQWLWDFGDGQTSSMQSLVHTYSVAGTYNVCLTITAGNCSDSACSTLKISCSPTGVSSSEQIDLSLFVNNPVFSSADIHYSIPSGGRIELALFDIIGNKISILDTGSKSAGTYSYLLNTGSYSNGIYFILLDFEGATITKKIIM